VLFVDARHLYRQVTRAHRTFDADHIEFIGNIVRLWRGENIETTAGSGDRTAEAFPKRTYRDVPGLCKIASLNDIKTQDWSLNPGRYVGATPGQSHDDEEFRAKLIAIQEELELLNVQARELEQDIATNMTEILRV
jgi:type I restriction enzyme M protein